MSEILRVPIHLHEKIHQRALDISARYRQTETELIEVLEQVETHKVYLHYGHPSLFQYGIKELFLSENIIYNLIAVMRKTKEVPQLKVALQEGNITLSNAKRIVPVLTKENQDEWLKKAAELTQRQLEKEVVKIRPLSAVIEKTSYVTESRVKLEVGLSEKTMLKLRRVQDLLSQARSNHSSMEDILIEMTEFYLKHHDPLLKAKRVLVKKWLQLKQKQQQKQNQSPNHQQVSRPVTAKRESIPSGILHQVNLRDQRQCTHTGKHGERCSQRRWIHIHHRTPVAQGGKNTLDNLTTLCSVHHQWIHSRLSVSAPEQQIQKNINEIN